jgi:ribosome biogenesis GTPase / thiamine phosphate phosphatase
VQAALADGSLADLRWASYRKLQRELSALAPRHDAAARRTYQREWHQRIAASGQSRRAAERRRHEKAEGRKESRPHPKQP